MNEQMQCILEVVCIRNETFVVLFARRFFNEASDVIGTFTLELSLSFGRSY